MVIPIETILKEGYLTNRDFGDGEGLVEPEGVGIDIRVGEIWEMVQDSEAFLKKKTRKTKEYKKVAEFIPGQDDAFILEPMKYYQFKSVEVCNIPTHVVARFIARYNLLANGIMVLAYKADPGYEGTMGVPIINLSGVPFEIELGARFGQFEFHEVKGEGVAYRGQWKGNRVFTPEEEEQV